MKRFLAGLAAAALLAPPLPAAEPAAATISVAHGRGGAVAAAEENAARVGIAILKKGGNATDAAVAVAFALAVTWPEAGNIGGGGFWTSRDANGRTLTIDFRERAPRAARRDMFLRPEGAGAAPPSSTEGPLASGVPGTVAGLALAHRKSGHLPWKSLVDPAVRLALEGFAMTENVRASIVESRKKLAADPEAAAIFLPGGEPPPIGSVFRQPALARTLQTIRDRGEDGFYRGRVAREFEQGQKRARGLITRGDLALYAAKARKPLTFSFRNADIVTSPAPSSGPVLAEMALLAEYVGLEKLKPRDPASAHWMAEIEKRAYSDRNRYLGDPDFGNVRQGLFTSPERLKSLAASINPARATPVDAISPAVAGGDSTTHFSVVDGAGAAVSVTTTLNDSFGSGRVAGGLGFVLNNEMDDFTTRPGQPNMFGLIQGPANAIAPGKRMLSAMCPSIAALEGQNALVWGSPGGSTIPTTNFQILINVLLRGESLEQAVEAPRFHQQDRPDAVQFEPDRFDAAWIQAMEGYGHTVVPRSRYSDWHTLGRVHAILRRADGRLTAVADPRSLGVALVVQPER
jgi:gamma-glutamyltranspeptidase/glutathione hydrolase